MTARITILFWLLFLGTGRMVLGDEFFPIGIYGLDATHADDLRILKAAGFNCIQSSRHDLGSLQALLKACAAEGLKALVYPGVTAADDFEGASLKQTIGSLGNSPSLLAWYLMDEPDFNKIPPERVEKMRQILLETKEESVPKTRLHWARDSGPVVPTALVIGDGRAAGDYAKTADILMVDWYPIPHLPLASFGLAVRQCRLAAGPEKPVWGVVQAFDWAAELPETEKPVIGRFPSETEIRAMAMLGVVEGASGLYFYSYQSGRASPITQRAEDWQRLKSVSHEFAGLIPILAAPTFREPIELGNEKDKPRWRNALGDTALQVACKRLNQTQGDFEKGDYLLAVNTTKKAGKGFLRVAGLRDGEVGIIGKNRSAAIMDGWIMDDFEPYATRIYGPLPLK